MMDPKICILLALCTATLGLALRLAVPVASVDAPFREVVRFYDSLLSPEREPATRQQ